ATAPPCRLPPPIFLPRPKVLGTNTPQKIQTPKTTPPPKLAPRLGAPPPKTPNFLTPAPAPRLFPASTKFRAISTPWTSAPSFAAGSAVVPSPQPRSRTLSPFVIPNRLTRSSPLSRIVAAIRVKSPFSQTALFGFTAGDAL